MFWEWKRIPTLVYKNAQYIILITVVLNGYFYRSESVQRDLKIKETLFFISPRALKSKLHLNVCWRCFSLLPLC